MTIKQIAEKAGTSRGTVDRVLNGRGNVNPEPAKRILDIAERERYQPNQLAQALIRSRQRTHIGMVIPSVGNPFFDEVLRGAQSRARKLSSYGTTLTIREIKGYDAATQLQAMRRLVAEGVDALAVMPLDVPEVAEYLQSLPIPVVTVNTDIDVDRVAFVGCDYYKSGMITGDLVQLMLNGRGRVAAVIGSTNVRGHMDRVRGLRTALEGTPEITVDAVLENQAMTMSPIRCCGPIWRTTRRTWCALPPPVSTAVCGPSWKAERISACWRWTGRRPCCGIWRKGALPPL